MKKKDVKEIDYWMQLTELIGMDRIQPISEGVWLNPPEHMYYPIHKVRAISLTEVGLTPESNMIKLVFRFEKKYETGLVYRFVGWEN